MPPRVRNATLDQLSRLTRVADGTGQTVESYAPGMRRFVGGCYLLHIREDTQKRLKNVVWQRVSLKSTAGER